MIIGQDYINEDDKSLLNIKAVYNPFQVPSNAVSVTPSDSDDLSHYGLLYIGTGGNVKVDLAGSGTSTYTVESGEWLPVLVKKVYSTDTTASGIVLHW